MDHGSIRDFVVLVSENYGFSEKQGLIDQAYPIQAIALSSAMCNNMHTKLGAKRLHLARNCPNYATNAKYVFPF